MIQTFTFEKLVLKKGDNSQDCNKLTNRHNLSLV